MLTERITFVEAFELTRNSSEATELMNYVNKLIEEKGCAVFSDLKYFYCRKEQ